MKRQCKKVLSLLLTLAILLPSMLTSLLILADEGGAYKATMYTGMKVAEDSEKTKDTAGVLPPYTASDVTDEVINDIAVQTVTITSDREYVKPWNGVLADDATNINSGKYHYTFTGVDEIASMDADDGAMFYVSTTSATEIDITFGLDSKRPVKERPYYLLAVGTKNWEEKAVKTTAWRHYGVLTLPAGFSGWVRVPASSMGMAAADPTGFTGSFSRFDVGVHNLGGKYGKFTVGAFMVIDKAEETHTNVSVNDGDSKTLLSEFKHHLGHMISGDFSAVGAVTLEETANKTVFENGKTFEIAAAAETTNAGAKLNAAADAAAEFNKDGSLIFYAAARLAVGNKWDVQVNGASMIPDSKVYLKNIGENSWQEVTVDANGKVELPALFEGYVMTPANVWGLTQNTKLESVSFLVDSVSTSKDRVRIGSVLCTDKADPMLVHVRVDGAEKLVYIYEPLLEVRHHKGHMISGDYSAIGAVTVEKTDNESAFATGNTYKIFAAADTTAAGATLNAAGDEAAVLEKDGSLIFYTRARIKAGNKLSVQVNGHGLTAGATVYLKNIGIEEWQPATVDADGYVALDAKFEGYVMVPTAVLGLTQDTKLESVSFVLDSVAASDDCVRIGSVLTSNLANSAITHVRLDSDSAFVLLHKKNYYHTDMLEIDTPVKHPADNPYFNISDKNTGVDVVPGLDEGYDYEMSVGSAEVGEHKVPHTEVENAAGVSKYYTGALAATVAGTNTKNGTTVVSEATVMTAEDAFVPGVSAPWVKFTWPDVAGFNTVVGAHCATPVTGLTPTEGDAVLFYVKLPANTAATQIGVRIQNMSGNRDLLANGKVYLLSANGGDWMERTPTIATEKVAGGTMKGVGYFDVPENFEGWVRVPIASTALEADVALKTLRVFLLNVGENYAADYVGIGAISVIDNADKAYNKLTVDAGNTFVDLGPSVEKPSKYYAGTPAATVSGTHTKVGSTIVSEATVMTAEDAFVPGVSAPWVKFTWPDVDAYNTVVGANCATPVTGLTPTEGDAVLFYVKLPANTPATQIGVRIQNMSGNRDLLANGKVYLLSANGSEWMERTPTIATEKVAGGTMKGVGYIDVPENFEGWVRVPIASTALEADVALKTVRVFLLNVGATYAADYMGVGAITVINNADKAYTDLTVDGGATFVKIGSTVEKPSKYYAGTPAATVSGTHTKNGTTIVNEATVMTAEDAFVPGVSAPWVKFTLLDVDAYNTIVGAHCATPVTGLTPTEGDAVLFYVKLPANTPATQIGVRIQNMSGNRDLLANGKVYLLPANGDAWLEKTPTIATEKVAGGTMKDVGYFDVPENFEGWVRVPIASTKLEADVALKTLRVFLLNVGATYAADYVGIGAITVINNADKDYGYLTTDGGSTFAQLGNMQENEEDESEKNFIVNMQIANGEKVMTTDALPEDMYVNFPLKNAVTMSTNDALMFYVRHTGRLDTNLRLDLGSNVLLAGKTEYKLYSASKEPSKDTWAVAKTTADGTIKLTAGFEGWIRIPFAALTDVNGKALADAFDFSQIRVLAYQLGGGYGTVRIGSFMLADYGTEDLTTMRVGLANEQALIQLRGYVGSIPPVQAVNAAVGTTATRVPRAALTEGYIYELSAKEQKRLDADMGTELVFFNVNGLLDGNRGVLAYVKIPEGKDNALAFGGNHAVMPGKEWFALAKGADSTWEKKTANEQGGMELPAGFEGYVRVPAASMKATASTAVTFMFAFEYVGGEYGSPLFGSVSFIDNADRDFTTYYSADLTFSESLNLADTLEGYVLTGEVKATSDTDNKLSVNMLEGNPLTPNVNGGFAFEFAPTGEAFKLDDGKTAPCATFVLDSLSGKVMGGSDSLMFYVKAETANDLWVQINGDNNVAMVVGSVYYTMAKNDAYWTTGVADRNGHIVFEEGFEGWVRIPYNQLKNGSKYLTGTIATVDFAFRYVGGDYGKPQIGTILFNENNANVGKLQLYGSSEKIDLYGTNQKPAATRDDVACWESVDVPFMGFEIGDTYPLTTTITKDDELESSATITNTIIEGLTPFATGGLKFSSDKAVTFSASDTPRFVAKMGISTEGGEGIVLYVKMPKRAEEVDETPEEVDQYANSAKQTVEVTNDLWVQFNTIQGRTLSLRNVAMIKTLAKGDTVWSNMFVDNRRIKLTNGFEGYVYLPFESLTSTTNSTTRKQFSMERDNMITALNIGFGEFGGDLGDAILGGLFVAKNDALSHNGAYVDGNAQCVDVFTGEAVDAEKVKQTVYDAPRPGDVYLEVPEATDPENYVFIESKTISSVTAAWIPVKNATRYRVDVYRSFALTTSHNAGMAYEHMYSLWVTDPVAVCEGLIMNNFYLVQVLAFNGDTGIEVLPATSAVPEGEIIGKMWNDDDEDFEYPWFTDEEPEEDAPIVEDQPVIDTAPEGEGEDEEIIVTETILRKKKAKKGIGAWVWPVAIGGGVVVAAGAALLIIVLVRRKKKLMNQEPASEETVMPEVNVEGGEQ